MPDERRSIALGHDYLTQRGGAERVVEVMARAFPGSPVYTMLYDEEGTFPSIADLDVRASGLNRSSLLRSNHRLALPLLRRAVDRTVVEADVLLTSSSGWAHGMSCTGRKIVYCHTPAHWLYASDRYLGVGREMDAKQRLRRGASRVALSALGAGLRDWDLQAAASADRYLVNSTAVQREVREIYGIEAEVVSPPALLPECGSDPMPGISRPFLLCVARLMPYKNVDIVIEAALEAGTHDLVVVGGGPDRSRLEDLAAGDPRIHLVGRVSDEQLRWLYESCDALVAASYEDYGLSPLEAASVGRPTVALRAGGYLDTVREGINGIFFDEPTSASLAAAIGELPDREWDRDKIRRHSDDFSEERFIQRLRDIVADELR